MEQKEIRRIFYRDGYRLANSFLAEELTREQLMAAISALYQGIDDLLAAFLERSLREGRPSECRKGCAWCCHQPVYAVTHELLYLHAHVKANFGGEFREGMLERARLKVKEIQNSAMRGVPETRMPCPFLEEGSCRIYAVRPMACRIYLSSSVAACRAAYANPADDQQFAELYAFPLQAGRMLNQGFVACLKQLGLNEAEMPIAEGLLALETSTQDFDSWLAVR